MNPIVNLFVLVVAGAILGWGTNVLAVRMLFRPRRPVRFLGFRLQGLIPRTQPELAEKISQVIVDHLLDSEDLHRILRKIHLRPHLKKVTDQIIEREFARLPVNRFRLSAGILDKVVGVVQHQVAKNLPESLDDVDEKVVWSVLNEIDLADHLRRKIDELDLDQLEQMIQRVSRKELRTIEYLGAVIGAMVGLVEGILFLML